MLSPPAAVLCCAVRQCRLFGALSPVACTQPIRLRLGLQSITVAAVRTTHYLTFPSHSIMWRQLKQKSRPHYCSCLSSAIVSIDLSLDHQQPCRISTIDQGPPNSLRSEFIVLPCSGTLLKRYQKFQPKPTNIHELNDFAPIKSYAIIAIIEGQHVSKWMADTVNMLRDKLLFWTAVFTIHQLLMISQCFADVNWTYR